MKFHVMQAFPTEVSPKLEVDGGWTKQKTRTLRVPFYCKMKSLNVWIEAGRESL